MGGCGLPPRFRVVCQGHERVLCRIEQRSLDAWMKLHRPELLGNRQEARGFSYYVDVLDAGSTDKADTLIAETDCWVQYEFTARDLNGNVCMTRNAVQAKQQGTFTRYTYYSPLFPLQRIGLYDAARRQLLCAARAADAQRGVYRRASGSRVEKTGCRRGAVRS